MAAAVLVALCGLAFEAAADRRVGVVRIGIASDVPASGGRAVHPLPDLSALRATPVVIHGGVRNDSSQPRRLRVLLDGFPRAELTAGPRAAARFAFGLTGGSARALTDGRPGDHRVEVSGQGDGWRTAWLEAANAHAGLEGVAAVVPAQRRPLAPARAPAWVMLAALGALATAWPLSFAGRRARLAHRTLAGLAVLALAVAAALPRASDYRLLLAPAVFWGLAAVVFAPALARVSGLLRQAAVAAWRHDPLTSERGAILTAFVALVVALPIFEVIRASPEFFVARNTTAATAAAGAALILLGLPAALLLAERVLRVLSPRASALLFHALVGLLGAALVHPWLRRGEVAGPWTMAAAACAAGVAIALLVWRKAGVRQLLAALAPAALVVPALFFGRTEVRESLTPAVSHVATPALARTPPIVLLVFDEFPLHSLLDAAGQIDAVRYPHFAALSRDSSWYRETTAVSSQTVWAVPAIASGRYPTAPNAVPTLRYYPENLFTLLAERYEMFVFGRFLQLCPEDGCHRDLEGPRDGPVALAADLGVVWLHIVSPAPLVDRLPPVVGDWLGFARVARWRSVDGRRVRNDRRSEFDRFLATIDRRPARLYFLHSLLPHMPFEYVPSERRYEAPDYQSRDERGAGLFERVDAPYADALHQRHLLQAGFVDTLIGRLVAHLRQLGVYDDALIVITADHGASYREGMPRRAARRQNLADILRVPLFIKRPGQRQGGPVDGIAESVDILPTITEALGVRLPFAIDGHALPPDTASPRTTRTFIDRSQTRIRRRDVADWRETSDASVARRLRRFGAGPWDALYVAPGTEDLVGRAVGELPKRDGLVRVGVEGGQFADADLSGDTLPLFVRGRVFDRSVQMLAVAVNGRVVATAPPFQERGATWFSTMIPEAAIRDGRNELQVFVVDRSRGDAALIATVR